MLPLLFGLYELEQRFKGKQMEGMLTPEERAESFGKHYPEGDAATRGQYALTGKFPPAQRLDTSMNEVEWADAQAQREGHRPGTPQYANRVGELRNSLRSPQRPSAGQISIQRQREATNIANVAIRNARKKVGNNPTLIYAEAIQDVLAGVEEKDVDPSIQRAIIQSIRRQLQPPPGGQREREGFSYKFGLQE